MRSGSLAGGGAGDVRPRQAKPGQVLTQAVGIVGQLLVLSIGLSRHSTAHIDLISRFLEVEVSVQEEYGGGCMVAIGWAASSPGARRRTTSGPLRIIRGTRGKRG